MFRFLPDGRCHPGYAILRSNFGFVNSNLGEFASIFIPFEGMSVDTVDIYFAAKVARQIAEVSSLFNNRAGAKL